MKLSTIFLLTTILIFMPSLIFAQTDVTIGNGATSGGSWSGANPDVWTSSGSPCKVNKDEIISRLNAGTSVTIYASNGSIIDSAGIAIWKTSGGDATLTLKAYCTTGNSSNVEFSSNDTIASTSGKLTIIFNSDVDGNGWGHIKSESAGCYFATNGGDVIMGGGSNPSTTYAYGWPNGNPATPGVSLLGAKIESGTGAISIRGSGHTYGSSASGVRIGNASLIQTTTGNISVYGNGISDYAISIYIYSDNTKIQSESGTINLTGTGNNGYYNTGLQMEDASRILTTDGNINITATGGSGNGGSVGVALNGKDKNDPLIETVDGTITIHATAGVSVGTNITNNYGLNMEQGAGISATGSGSIDITATGAGGTNCSNNYGIYVNTSQSTPTFIRTNSGNISVRAIAGAGSIGTNSGMKMYSHDDDPGSYITSTSGKIDVHVTSANGGHALDMWGYQVYIKSSGDVNITADVSGTGNSGYGILLVFGAYLKTTGNGNLTINSTGAATGSYCHGIGFSNYSPGIETEAGDLTINATGGGTEAPSYGINMSVGSIRSTSGRVIVNATGGAVGSGVYMDANTSIRSESGSVYVTATANGSSNYAGLYLNGYSGTITIESVSGDTCFISATGSGSTASGIYAYNNIVIGNPAFAGELIVETHSDGSDQVYLYGTTFRGIGNLTLRPKQVTSTIGIAGASGSFNLTTYDLDGIQNGFRKITIGRNDGTGTMKINARTFTDSLTLLTGSGAININGALSVGTNSLTIISDGTVTQSAVITANELFLNGSGTFNLNTQNNAVGTLYADAAVVKFRKDASLTIGKLSAIEATLNTENPFSKTGDFSVSSLTLAGSGVYSISDTVQKLTLLGTGSLKLNGPFAADTLVMDGGYVDASLYTFSLGTSTSSVTHASRTSGMYAGTFKRWFSASTISNAMLMAGASPYFRPATISFATAPTSGGSITAEFIPSNPGSSGLPLADADEDFVTSMTPNGYWRLTSGDGLTGGIYNLDLDANAFIGITVYPKIKILKRTNDSSPWVYDGTHVAGTYPSGYPVAHRTGMSGFSEFGIGQGESPTPVFSCTPSSVDFNTVAINSTKTDSIKIKNTGTKVMNIDSLVLSNTSFVTSQGDTTVAVGDSVMYYITFQPTTMDYFGGSNALRIYHNATGSPSSIELYGHGIAEEPTVQASNISFSDVTSRSITVNWTNGNGSNRIVVVKSGSAVDVLPFDGIAFNPDTRFGYGDNLGSDNYVVYNGTGSSVKITGLIAETDYYVAVMEYNSPGNHENYLTDSPLTGMQTTPARVITIWSKDSATVTFTKANYANHKKSKNQDRITEDVWITRASSQGLFNIASESSFDGMNGSPAGTEWAYGTTADIGSLTFESLMSTNGWNPPSMVGRDMVLHLIEEDIYLDIQFSSWQQGDGDGNGGGGGFSYERAAGPLEVAPLGTSSMSSTSATITGKVFSRETEATAYIVLGTESGVYTDSIIAIPDPVNPNSLTTVSAEFTGLTEGVTYYYRVGATNGSLHKRSSEDSFVLKGVQIWSRNKGTITFTKRNYADYTQEVNQDRITDNVWITRDERRGIFNIKSESSYDDDSYTSPLGTEWALGTTDDIGSLTFTSWREAYGGEYNLRDNIVGANAVLHIIDEDIYIDIKFLSWTSGNGGGFSYVRAGGLLEVQNLGWSALTATSVTIKGKIFSQDSASTAFILFGTESGVYDSVLATPNTITADSMTIVSADFVGLNPHTTYYYCVSASNGIFYKRSRERSFVPRDITVWTGSSGTINFSKVDSADYTDPRNQDQITNNVSITRANYGGVFNISSEEYFDSYNSPVGTEWALGTTGELGSLTFQNWRETYGSYNNLRYNIVDADAVLHLIADDIYIDIKFLSWTSGGNGGGFSYVRAAGPLEVQNQGWSAVTATSATIKGKVFSRDSSATAYLLYGTTSGVYNDSVLVTPNTIPADNMVSVSADLTGLSNGTIYYYRLSVYNGSSYKRSCERDFITFAPLQGNALKFDGSDDYVELPYLSVLNPPTFTYEFWARVDSGNGNYRSPVSTRYYTGWQCFGVNFYATDANAWEATIGTGVGGASWAGVTGSAVENGVWTHLASTYDGTIFRFYINGILQDSTVVTFSPNTYGPLRFGRVADGDAFFNGAIDEVRIWNTARTQEQIQATMNTPFTEPQTNLVAYWQLNENTGTKAHELINGKHGTLYSFNFDATDGWKSSDAPLPVELTSFTATAERLKAVLAWTTATELNCAGFEIERRTVNNNVWQKIGYITGSGTSNVAKEYSYSDVKLFVGRYEYRLKQLDLDGSFKYSQSVEVEVGTMPKEFTLSQNYPNPFNPTTTIEFTLKENGFTTLKVYDMIGREVATLVNDNLEAGVLHQAEFKASNLSSGVYFYRLVSGNSSIVKKLLMMK